MSDDRNLRERLVFAAVAAGWSAGDVREAVPELFAFVAGPGDVAEPAPERLGIDDPSLRAFT